MVLATDEVFTYAIFNYADMQWTSHTESGGDTTGGEGGVPAFVSWFWKLFSTRYDLMCPDDNFMLLLYNYDAGGIQRWQRYTEFRVLPVFAEVDHQRSGGTWLGQ